MSTESHTDLLRRIANIGAVMDAWTDADCRTALRRVAEQAGDALKPAPAPPPQEPAAPERGEWVPCPECRDKGEDLSMAKASGWWICPTCSNCGVAWLPAPDGAPPQGVEG